MTPPPAPEERPRPQKASFKFNDRKGVCGGPPFDKFPGRSPMPDPKWDKDSDCDYREQKQKRLHVPCLIFSASASRSFVTEQNERPTWRLILWNASAIDTTLEGSYSPTKSVGPNSPGCRAVLEARQTSQDDNDLRRGDGRAWLESVGLLQGQLTQCDLGTTAVSRLRKRC
jgi:hypothetical protein